MQRELKKTVAATGRITLKTGLVIFTAVWTDGNGIFCLYQNKPVVVRQTGGSYQLPEYAEV